ncbi:MAG TPA: hypothetical protein VME43_25970 [Bryobacteraceae bacterium]|nr:hypothetical protein [Bryobacteraceae bacterium]
MMIFKLRYWLLFAAIALISGCGKQERIEAIQLAKTLQTQQANFVHANAVEKDFTGSARAWCDGITANGAGRGAELDQNSSVAAQLAKSAVAVSSQLSQVRQAIDGLNLTEEFPQHVRDQLTTQLTQRQRGLQDMRALLEQSAPQFLEYKKIKTYAGDTYPDGIGKLAPLMRVYKPPEDVLGAAIASLQQQYGFKPGEI